MAAVSGLEGARRVVVKATKAPLANSGQDAQTAIDLRRGRFPMLQTYMSSHPGSGEELAYLANALVAGCSIQGRAFTPVEARDAAMATANLGFESHRAESLVTAFQAGWSVLHRDVSVHAAKRLMGVIAKLHCTDRDIHADLQSLRRTLRVAVRDDKPWTARAALEAILMLDAPCWAATT